MKIAEIKEKQLRKTFLQVSEAPAKSQTIFDTLQFSKESNFS